MKLSTWGPHAALQALRNSPALGLGSSTWDISEVVYSLGFRFKGLGLMKVIMGLNRVIAQWRAKKVQRHSRDPRLLEKGTEAMGLQGFRVPEFSASASNP